MRESGERRKEEAVTDAAFGAKNRTRLINQYFLEHNAETIAPHLAWAHVYRLLLWIDQTIGLAHCYESDKSQPGQRWYARSLAFHDWVAAALAVPPGKLSTEIDWLFYRAAEDLAASVLRHAAKVTARAQEQRVPYEGRGFPRPGEDPELILVVKTALGQHLASEPSAPEWDALVQRIRQYLALDNKRKNLVGEGFEDVLAQVVRRTVNRPEVQVSTRKPLHELPGFNRQRQGDKPNKVDVSVIRPAMRTLITAKWSVRADREKQFITDYAEYINAESDRKPFEYVFVTNEFDPARLTRACEQLSGNAPMFTHVVHISTDAVEATYGQAQEDGTMQRVLQHIESGRLSSLERWLGSLT